MGYWFPRRGGRALGLRGSGGPQWDVGARRRAQPGDLVILARCEGPPASCATVVKWDRRRYSIQLLPIHIGHMLAMALCELCVVHSSSKLPHDCFSGSCPLSCLNGGHCVHADSCNCSLYRATGSRCQTVANMGFEREMICRTWGQYNYETFDGLYYYFPGMCSYTLVRDCEDPSHTGVVVQVHNDPGCRSSPYSCARSVSLYLPWEGEIRLHKYNVTFKGQSIELPHSIHDVELERISQYILVTQQHGFTLAWEGDSCSVYIKMSPEHVGRTCGLCGNFNADIHDDLRTSYGVFTEDLAMFGNSWMEIEPQRATCSMVPSQYPSPCFTQDNHTLQKVKEVCALLLEDPFKPCHEFVSPFPYMASCSNDLCVSGPNSDAVCRVLAEYARACGHAEHPLQGWREHIPQCAVLCPTDLLYRECISCCPVSCSMDRMCIDSRLECLDGCYCPEDQIYESGHCVEASDCPCEYHGTVYMSGQTVQEDCNSCTCMGGLWNCTEHTCPGECSVTGDIYFETFDGRTYTFHAMCQYVLAKSRSSGRFTVTIQNAPCGPNLDGACIQSVTLVINEDPRTEITLTRSGEVFVSGQHRVSLPYSDEVFHIQELSTMFLQVRAAHGLRLLYNWREFRLYLQVDEFWKDDTVGLCGTFNGNSQDDFLSPSGMIESTPQLFGSSWKLSSACMQSPGLPQLDPCDTHQQAASYAAEMCSVLDGELFSPCHKHLSPMSFVQRCKADTCKCGKPCLCSALAHYARQCRKHGVNVDFRAHVTECALQCPKTTEYGTCVSSCQRRCPSDGILQRCGEECEEGCVCPHGTLYKSRTRTCVHRSECPCVFLGVEYAPGDVIMSASGVQVCQGGRMIPESSVINKTCPLGQHYHDCAQPGEEPFLGKGLECEQTCETYLLNLTCSTHEPCVPGCVCPPGLLKHGDECFQPETCPCVWKGKEYYPGDKVTSPCHHCVCQHGTFRCEFRPCPVMCTVYGDRHYRTFDGMHFDYVGACKVYLVKSSVDLTMSVTAENVDCYDSGVICRKSLLISIARSLIVFDDDSGKPNPLSVIDRQQGVLLWQAGYFTILHVPKEDITVLWDRKTTIHIQAGPRWQGKLTGLCGNFDTKTVNEMRTPENMVSATPQEFGNSWTAAECVNTPDIRHPCSLSPLREPFAKRQCGILLGELFQACHPVVDVTWFYGNCLSDTCGCSRGGDCECFCTSVSAYAHRCCQMGVTVDWRSPAVCLVLCAVLGKGPFRLVTYRDRGTALAANISGGVVFPLKGVSPTLGVTALFMMTPGLSRTRPHDTSLVSFEVAERPNYFLRADQSGRLRVVKWEENMRFWDESTFKLHRDTWINGYDSLESFARRGHFLHVVASQVRLMKYKHTDGFRKSTLFRLTATDSGIFMGPRCQWRYESCISPCFKTCSDPSGRTCIGIPKVEGCVPQCLGHMVLDEVTQRCVHVEDCIRPAVAVEPVTPGSTVSAPVAVTSVVAPLKHSTPPAMPTSALLPKTTGTASKEPRVSTTEKPSTLSAISLETKTTSLSTTGVSTSTKTTELPYTGDRPESPVTIRMTSHMTTTIPTTISPKPTTEKSTTAAVSPLHQVTPATTTTVTLDLTSSTTQVTSKLLTHTSLSTTSGEVPTTTISTPVTPTSPKTSTEKSTVKAAPTYGTASTAATAIFETSRITTTPSASTQSTAVYSMTTTVPGTQTTETTETTSLSTTSAPTTMAITTSPYTSVHTAAVTSPKVSLTKSTEFSTLVSAFTTLRTTQPATLEMRSPLTSEVTSKRAESSSPVELRTSTTPVPTFTLKTTLSLVPTSEILPSTQKTTPVVVMPTSVSAHTSTTITTTATSMVPIPEKTSTTTTTSPPTSTVSTFSTSWWSSVNATTRTKAVGVTNSTPTEVADWGQTTTASAFTTQTTTTQPISVDVSRTTMKTLKTPTVTAKSHSTTATTLTSTSTLKVEKTPGFEMSTTAILPTVATTERMSTVAVERTTHATTSSEYAPLEISSTPVYKTDTVTTMKTSPKPLTLHITSTPDITTARPFVVTSKVTEFTSPVSLFTTVTSETPSAISTTATTTVPPEISTMRSLATMTTSTSKPPTLSTVSTTMFTTPSTSYTPSTEAQAGVSPTRTTVITPVMEKTMETKFTTWLTSPSSTYHPINTTFASTVTSEKLSTESFTTLTTETAPTTTSTLGTTQTETTRITTSTAASPVTTTETSTFRTSTKRVTESLTTQHPVLATTTTVSAVPTSSVSPTLSMKETSTAVVTTASTTESLHTTKLDTTTTETTSKPTPSMTSITTSPLDVRYTTRETTQLLTTTSEKTSGSTSSPFRTSSAPTTTTVADTTIETKSTKPSPPDWWTSTESTTLPVSSKSVETVVWKTTGLPPSTSAPHTSATAPASLHTTETTVKTTSPSTRMCTPPYSEVIDECTKYVCVGGQMILFNKTLNCPYSPSPPNCGLLGFAILVNGDKCCPLWDCPCRCSVFPDLNVITFDGNSVAIYKAATYIISQLPNETVSIQVQECQSPDKVPSKLLWNFTSLCLVALNITHNSHQVLINRVQRRLYVNTRYAKPRFRKYGFEVLDTGNMYLIRTPEGMKMQWFHSTGMLVIEIESHNKLSTVGLCGCCDGNPTNDLTLSNGTTVSEGEDPAVFIDSWQVPNTTSYVSYSRRREVNCSTSDCSQCLDMLHNDTFGRCHAFVPPSVFCELWVRDEEYVKNPCVSLAAYVASCHKFNVCIEWRRTDYCPFTCPAGLRYQACLPACTAQVCPNHEFDSEPAECSGLTEGCVCPEGTLLHRPYSALCIPSEKCACTDSFGNPRAPGEVWTASKDGCCVYKCENDSIVPVEYDCSDVPQPVCRRTGEVTVSLADDKSCCPKKVCVCNQTLCEGYPPECKYGEKIVSYFREDSCCPDYICECDPDRCESDVPTCREDQTLIATRADGSCCLAHICMCGACTDVIPECQEGEVLTVDANSTDRCCPVYHCVCEPYRCAKFTCPLGMSVIAVSVPEHCCPVHTCECACDTIPVPRCRLGEVMQLDQAFLMDPQNQCSCKKYKCEREAVCIEGERGVMRPGQTLVEHSAEGICYTTHCTRTLDPATGFYRTRASSTNCSSKCKPNQVYIPPKDQTTCCGTCKNISCIYKNENGSVELYKPGRTWMSNCLKYNCADTLSGPMLVSYPISCPPFNETECMKIGGSILTYMDGCCKTCTGLSLFPFPVSPLTPTVSTDCERGKEDGKSCQKVTVRMTIRKNDCRSNRPVNIVSCDGKCPSASIYNYNINTYARFCKCCREMGLQRRTVQLYCSGNSTWVSYTIQEPTDCSCQWS
ncbi:otogelin [Arapaima gigas]